MKVPPQSPLITPPGVVSVTPGGVISVQGRDKSLAQAVAGGYANKYRKDEVRFYQCPLVLERLQSHGFSFAPSARQFEHVLQARTDQSSALLGDQSPVTGFEWLRPVQAAGVRWLQANPRSLLLDQLRMGKTTTVLSAAAVQGCERVLIVCAKNLVGWWVYELARRFKARAHVWDETRASLSKRGVHICHFQHLYKWQLLYKSQEWDMFVFDEAHRLKGQRGKSQSWSQIYQSVMAVCEFSQRVHLLTGSPVDGKPHELWSLMHILDRQQFGSFWQWAETFAQVSNTEWGMNVQGSRNVDLLKSLLSLWAISRSQQWQEAVDEAVLVPMGQNQRQAYDQMLRDWMLEYDMADGETGLLFASNAIARSMRLRQILTHPALLDRTLTETPKIDAAVAIAEERGSDNGLVFAPFRDTVLETAKRLSENGHEVRALIPGTGWDAQDTSLWLAKGSNRIVVTTPESGGEGLGFHGAQYTIFLGIPWSSIKYGQCRGRMAGPDQTSDTIVYYHMITPGTIDDRLYQLCQTKQEFNEQILARGLMQSVVRKRDMRSIEQGETYAPA